MNTQAISILVKIIKSDLGITSKTEVRFVTDELAGFCQKVRGGYIVHIKAGMDNGDTSIVLAHELKHVQQQEVGKLIVRNSDEWTWNGASVNISEVSYDSRPWEIEAVKYSRKGLRFALEADVL